MLIFKNFKYTFLSRVILALFINVNTALCYNGGDMPNSKRIDQIISNWEHTACGINFNPSVSWLPIIILTAIVGIFFIATVVTSNRYIPETHPIDYYIKRYTELTDGLLQTGSINEGQYLDLYNKILSGYNMISEQDLPVELKIKKLDVLLFYLKTDFIPEILSGKEFDLGLTTEMIAKLLGS